MPPLSRRFDEAFALASELHRGQRRKSTQIPYISHLMAVCALVIESGGDEDEAIAALLHDAIEDQGGPQARAQILGKFGPRVTAIVDGCTDTDEVPKPPWRERKQAYINHLAHASQSVLRVSLADKVHNARAILSDFREVNDRVWVRFAGGKEGTLWYYRSLATAFRAATSLPMVDEFERVISELERLSK
jgi:(p)ppGpp synthase/HD superfamily hydrolase